MSVATTKPQFDSDTGGRWPRTGTEAYARYRGPYTVENASTLLEEEPLELYNGWLVWDKLTDVEERGYASTIHVILDFTARWLGFGHAYPDQLECELEGGDVIKPDVCLISNERIKTRVELRGPDNRRVLQGGPELAIELRSPSNTRAEEKRKRTQYFENGTSIVWDVDPKQKRIWVFRAENPEQYVEFKGNARIDCEPFLPGWRRRTADFFTQNLTAEEVAGQAAQEWRADERQKERLNALREMLLLQAQVKFGPDLSVEAGDDLTERLNRLDTAQLTALVTSIATAPTLAEWLASIPA